MSDSEYTVRLEELFHGPMDLLLHLVKEQEVDICDVEINRVIDGYLKYLDDLQAIDIELAGEFVVMAATLMAIKSRSLLPKDEVDLEEELDPRDELIQRLIEYRRFKEASRDLGDRFSERAMQVPRADVRSRVAGELSEQDEPTMDFGELTAWDLLSAFSRLMRETGRNRKLRITSDDRPMRYYVDELVRFVRDRHRLHLRDLVAHVTEAESRNQVIGSFCALLELMRLGVVTARQERRSDDIEIALRPEHEGDIEEIVSASGLDAEMPELQGLDDGPPAPSEN